MKKLLFLLGLLLVLAIPCRSQAIQFTASVPHTNGTPSGTPSTQGSRLRYDRTNHLLYRWNGSAWTAGVGTGIGGIYSGSGTIPASTVATATNGFRMNSGASGQILLGDYTSAGLGGNLNLQGSGAILGTPGYQFRAQADDAYIQTVSPGYTIRLEPTTAYTLIQSTATNGYKFWDTRATPRGVEYSADYSATYNDRSLMDFGSVKALVSDSLAAGGGGSTPTLDEVATAGASTSTTLTLGGGVKTGSDVFLIGLNDLSEGFGFTTNEATTASFSHANTTDHTYTLPDASGVFVLANGTGAAFQGAFRLKDPSNTTHVDIDADGYLSANRTYTVPDRSGTIRVGADYKVYTALLSQSGTSAPTATVLENTLGGTVVWTRDGAGIYHATLTGAFPANKLYTTPDPTLGYYFPNIPLSVTLYRSTDDVMILESSGGEDIDSTIQIEIRVYP